MRPRMRPRSSSTRRGSRLCTNEAVKKHLHEIKTTTGATRHYWTFYPRYFEALKSYALRFCRSIGRPCDEDEAARLAHDFILEHHALHDSNKGFLRRYNRGSRFRPYVVVVFRNYLRKKTAPSRTHSLPADADLPAADGDSPADLSFE